MAKRKPDETIDLKAAAQAAAQEVGESKNTDEAIGNEERVELTPKEIDFEITYDGPDGTDYSATLRSRVMDSDARLAKARVVAQLTRGLAVDALGQEDRFRVEALSRASIMLVEPPQWIYDFMGEDLELLMSINQVLMEHEARYFRGNARKGQGDQIKPRVSTSVAAFAAPSAASERSS